MGNVQSNPMYDPKTGRSVIRGHRDVGGYRASVCLGATTFADANPWTVRTAREASSGLATGRRVKFKAGADLAKTVNRMMGSGGGGGSITEAQYNPKELGLDKSKVIVRGWNPEKKEEYSANKATAYPLKKEEGGRHTPFQNKYRPQFGFRTRDVTGEIELEAGREMTTGLDVEYRLYGPGQAHWGNATVRWGHASASSIISKISARSISNVLKTKHDTAKNSVGNIR